MSDPDLFAPPSSARTAPSPERTLAPAEGPHTSDAWYPAVSPAMAPNGLARWAIALAAAWTAVQVLMFATSFAAAEAFSQAWGVGGNAGSVWTTYDSVGMLVLPVQIAAFVVTCLWLQRSRELAVAFRPRERHARSAAWLWLGWLVPVVSLWFPFQVVRDVRAGSTGRRHVPGLGLWWLCWLVMLTASQRAAWLSGGFGTVDPSVLPVLDGIATAAILVCLVRWIGIVREVTAAQRSLLAG